MKIFEINGIDYWMANTAKEAKEDYIRFIGLHAEVYDEGPIELTDNQLDSMTFVDCEDNYKKCTFREEMLRRMSQGAKSEFFASAEF